MRRVGLLLPNHFPGLPSYRLPDDVTAWRVGAAAITADRRAGQATMKIPVGLPFFVDATIAPILWRLPVFGIKLPAQARPIQRYMDDVFSRPSFQASLTDMERELRQ